MSNNFNFNLNSKSNVQEIAKLLERQNEYFKTIDFSSLLKRANEQYHSLSKIADKAALRQDHYLNSDAYKQAHELSQNLAKIQHNYINSDAYKQAHELSQNLAKIQHNYINSDAYKQAHELSQNLAKIQHNYINSDAYKQAHELSQRLNKVQYNFLNSNSYLEFSKKIKNIQNALNKNQNFYKNHINQYREFVSSVVKNVASHDVQINLPIERLVKTCIDQIDSNNLKHNQSFSEPLNNLMPFSQAAAISGAPQNEKDFISLIIQFFNYQIVSLPSSSEAIRNYINYFFFIFVFIIQSQTGNASQAELLSLMEYQHVVMFSKITELINMERSQDLHYYYFLNKKQSVSLVNKPSFKSAKVVVLLYPGQRVRIVESKGDWIKVEFFSFISNQHHSGWHKKKYFKKIKIQK